ncbi:serine phosphatase RsbU (regulator of sigma subunit) [Blastococcus colisei]|uniref:protein-serine/threonine phosphatase n=1 Tax=Blastococcus colisei TaxID=1564162 RepID=A0A543PJ69_9ACTN|nr:SpoIIE family protein phosphatase [Blastococcus colisei]TQN44109.1 serine phosphatase RsbU (regulator of sigma subunit) [Blastococcus colisei]
MTDAASSALLPPELLGAALDALPEGIAIFDVDWTIVYVNPVGAGLLARGRDQLVDRNIWIALPELGGSIFHSFLLHARSIGEQLTWQGYYAPTGRFLSATAVRIGDRLQVSFREVPAPLEEHPLATHRGERPVEGPGGVDLERLRFLAEIRESMIGTLDTGESVARLVDLLVPRLCDWTIVTVIGEDGRPSEVGRGHRDPGRLADLDTYLTGRVRGTGDDSPLAAALFSGEPVQMDVIDPSLVEASLATEEVREAWRRLDAGSFTMVPLRARGETFGAIGLINTSQRPPHSEMEIATAMEVARRASLPLDNARLYEQQSKVAETLQRSLLTPPPQPDHLEIAVRYQPAASNMHVGGDWYDAFQQPDGATLLVIGDVIGHNVEAAAAMGQVRSILRGIAYDRQEGPASILTRVDEVLTGLRIGTLATALIARLEQPTERAQDGLRTLRWSSAGHLPPLVLHPDGRVAVLDTRPEILLGAESRNRRTDHEARLRPGDTLLFYTDGLVEHGRSLIDEGIARLVRVTAEAAHLTVDELCDQLLERIVRHRSDDDIAIVVVRCHPHDASGPSSHDQPVDAKD